MAKYKRPWWSGMSCYACEAVASGEDHAPPKMIFPEAKDTGGVVYRDGIVRVPACRIHNEKFSKDDEYVSAIVTMSLQTNPVGLDHFRRKIFRALQRRPAFARTVFKNARTVRVSRAETMAFTIDLSRWERGMRKITAALMFHGTGKRLTDWSIMRVYSPDLRMHDTLQSPLEPLRHRYDGAPQWVDVKSGHPQAYSGRYITDSHGSFMFEHLFYQGFRVWVFTSLTSESAAKAL